MCKYELDARMLSERRVFYKRYSAPVMLLSPMNDHLEVAGERKAGNKSFCRVIQEVFSLSSLVYNFIFLPAACHLQHLGLNEAPRCGVDACVRC